MDGNYTEQEIFEWFAGQALIGIKSNPELMKVCEQAAKESNGKPEDYVAKMAFADAKAMMRERERNRLPDYVTEPELNPS